MAIHLLHVSARRQVSPMLDVRTGMYSSACTVVLVNSGPSLPAERYGGLRGAVQKKIDSSCLCFALSPNKLILCSSYCLGKPVMLFSFLYFFLLFSLLFSLPPSLFLSLLRFLLWLALAQPSFCEFVRASAAELRPGTCLLRGGSSPSAYSMRRAVLAIGRCGSCS